MIPFAVIHEIVSQTLATKISDVQDQIVPETLRPLATTLCVEHEWHPSLAVCVKCGATAEDVFFRRYQHN